MKKLIEKIILKIFNRKICLHTWKPSKTRWNSVDCVKCGNHKAIL